MSHNKLIIRLCVAWLLLSLMGLTRADTEHSPIRVGVLKFGTVNWELDVIRHHGLDAANGFVLEVVPLGSKNAVAVALQGGAVDIIVTDWIWVARQVAAGKDYAFHPHSLMAGGVVVRPDAGINSLADLRGKRIGIAGGPVDKSWLLLRAYGRQQLGIDLKDHVEPVFAAPPLLNELIKRGDLDAVLNFWHYKARLEEAGMKSLIDTSQLLTGLGVDRPVPIIGWVFSRDWAERRRDELAGFLRATQRAKDIMQSDDAEWRRLKPLTRAGEESLLERLRDTYRAGIPPREGPLPVAATGQAFAILAREGGEALVGPVRDFDPAVFWQAEQR